MATDTDIYGVINLPNRLAEKVDKGSGPSLDTIVAQAESALQRFAAQYATVAAESIKAMRRSLLALESGQDPTAIQRISAECHALKGQAASFGFSLLGMAAASLDEFIRVHHDLALERQDLIKLHVEAFEVLAQMGAEDGERGGADDLLAGLRQAVSKVIASRP